MLRAADSYYDQNDFRWFFAYAHGQITKQINQNVMRFQRPDALLRLNIHFAEEFLRAVGGQPHEGWRRAFRACQVLQDNASTNILLAGEVEFCGAAMANVHIRMDLSAALLEVGCIPPEDYGNMLIFVNRGSLAALVRLRGRSVGAAEAILQQLVAPLVELEVKAWRNTVYQDACNTPVPDPVPQLPIPAMIEGRTEISEIVRPRPGLTAARSDKEQPHDKTHTRCVFRPRCRTNRAWERPSPRPWPRYLSMIGGETNRGGHFRERPESRARPRRGDSSRRSTSRS